MKNAAEIVDEISTVVKISQHTKKYISLLIFHWMCQNVFFTRVFFVFQLQKLRKTTENRMRRSRGFKSSKRRMMLRQIQTVVIIIRGESRVQILKKVMILCYLQTSFCSWKFSTAALTCFFFKFLGLKF